MKYLTAAFLVLCSIMSGYSFARTSTSDAKVNIVIPPEASSTERIASEQLVYYLAKLYPEVAFNIIPLRSNDRGSKIFLGCKKSFPELGKYVAGKEPSATEGFIVSTANIDGRTAGIIFGSDPRGVIYGVYRLLEKLGFGFYLSFDTMPSARAGQFSFDGWDIRNEPLVRDRIVFNWHNFLSGCSTWNLTDWESWIRQSQKMGYNGVMVHAYGNNPMVQFSFNGVDKPVGYLSTTQKGRDWSTQHVNDVRRLWGGEVFDGPVFGSEAAIVSDSDRADAANRLMHDVFEFAEQRDVDVYFAVDVDTASANPQAVIETLPANARFAINAEKMAWMNQQGGKIWLANPDTPDGYRYYKAQVESLMSDYPQIDCLIVWFRHGNTPWMALKVEEMLEQWQEEYRDELNKTPEAAKLWRSHNFFAINKIVKAFERALEESGNGDVRIAIGSWRFDFLPGCDRFLPSHVTFIPLDYEILHDRSRLRNSQSRQVIREVGAHRPVLPVVWAHHDDGNYIGRPYTPYSDFYSKLVDSRAGGFGIIHWTTRPLDLYFKSLAEQVWRTTENRSLRDLCDDTTLKWFGAGAQKTMAEYLYLWITEAPKIGRETSDFFIDRKLGDMDVVAAGYLRRTKLLGEIEGSKLEPEAEYRLSYFKGLERFILDVHRTEDAFQRSKERYKAGDLSESQQAMTKCKPESIIQEYARFSNLDGITRGEQGLVVSMNLRWLTHYVRHRQMLGIEAVRFNFAPTSHDPLAQSMGTFTFHFGPEKKVWECLGTEETGAPIIVIPADVGLDRDSDLPAAYEEICHSGIETDKPISITLQPIMTKGGRGRTRPALLPTGDYSLLLLMLNPDSTERRILDITVQNNAVDRIDMAGQKGQKKSILTRSYPVKLVEPGHVSVTLKPVQGKAILCGAILTPEPEHDR